MMSDSSVIDRDNIYGRSDDSGWKVESFSKISEKSCSATCVNIGNNVNYMNSYS